MRIAVISDIHANLPALEEVLKGIDSQHPDALFCLGDLVNQNVWNNEVIDIMRHRKIPTIKGNHDDGIAQGKHFFPFSYTFPDAKEWGKEAIEFTLSHITKENQLFLEQLPSNFRLKLIQKEERPYYILMTHGGPRDINEKFYHFTPKKEFEEALTVANADILITGNTHRPYHHLSFPKR